MFGEVVPIGDLQTVIGSLGFPIFVAVWMLYRSSKDSQDLRGAIQELTKMVTLLYEKEGR